MKISCPICHDTTPTTKSPPCSVPCVGCGREIKVFATAYLDPRKPALTDEQKAKLETIAGALMDKCGSDISSQVTDFAAKESMDDQQCEAAFAHTHEFIVSNCTEYLS